MANFIMSGACSVNPLKTFCITEPENEASYLYHVVCHCDLIFISSVATHCTYTCRRTTLVMKALSFPRHTRICIAIGEIYDGKKINCIEYKVP